mmetsp:Transcript_120315/g.334703  ORF Transcript_120315/g.334703 Transcript_120315/m.334703 type:complete len:124 (-) Transcript_120315:334-705(-)
MPPLPLLLSLSLPSSFTLAPRPSPHGGGGGGRTALNISRAPGAPSERDAAADTGGARVLVAFGTVAVDGCAILAEAPTAGEAEEAETALEVVLPACVLCKHGALRNGRRLASRRLASRREAKG